MVALLHSVRPLGDRSVARHPRLTALCLARRRARQPRTVWNRSHAMSLFYHEAADQAHLEAPEHALAAGPRTPTRGARVVASWQLKIILQLIARQRPTELDRIPTGGHLPTRACLPNPAGGLADDG